MKFYNKCSENSRSQIVSRRDISQKLTLAASGIQCINKECGETVIITIPVSADGISKKLSGLKPKRVS